MNDWVTFATKRKKRLKDEFIDKPESVKRTMYRKPYTVNTDEYYGKDAKNIDGECLDASTKK